MSTIDYSEKIPNNVGLAEDKALQRALEHWQPNYLSWWQEMGPDGAQDFDVYLRTAVSVERNSPGTCCHAGWPMLSPKPTLRSATGSARKMPQR